MGEEDGLNAVKEIKEGGNDDDDKRVKGRWI